MLQFPPPPMDSSRWKPNIELAPNCPRCASSNTKFCYFNNYNLSQPRYFCKECRRYWTKGGSLRNVPVGGGCRKTRRPKSSTHPQTSRASVNYTARSSGISGSGVTNKPNEVNCSDIDMAVLFARFVNQYSENDANGSSSSNLSTSLRPEGWLPREESFEGEELGEIELEGLLGGDEAVQDVFWSDDRTSSSLTWQLQQKLEYSMAMPFNRDDQLPITSRTNNLINDGWNWSSFDVSTLEAFSPKP